MRELTLTVGKIDYSTGNPLSKRKIRTRISAVYLYQTPPPPQLSTDPHTLPTIILSAGLESPTHQSNGKQSQFINRTGLFNT